MCDCAAKSPKSIQKGFLDQSVFSESVFSNHIITAFQVPSQGFPGGSAGKESTCNAGDLDLIPGLGRSPGEGKGYPLQYSGLENYTDCIVHGVAKSWAPLSDFHSQVPSQAQLGLKWEQVPGAAGWSLRLRSDKCLPSG